MSTPIGAVIVATCQDQAILTTPAALLAYTPVSAGLYAIDLYLYVDHLQSGSTGVVTFALAYTDATGARSIASGPGYGFDSGGTASNANIASFVATDASQANVIRYLVSSAAGQAISFTAVNASQNGTVKVSGSVTKL